MFKKLLNNPAEIAVKLGKTLWKRQSFTPLEYFSFIFLFNCEYAAKHCSFSGALLHALFDKILAHLLENPQHITVARVLHLFKVLRTSN